MSSTTSSRMPKRHPAVLTAITASWLLSAIFLSTQLSPVRSYELRLQNLYVSHGILSPSFVPTTQEYSLELREPHDQIAVTPEINQSRPEYGESDTNLPRVTISWDNGPSVPKPESASVAVRRQIDIPEGRDKFKVVVKVANPHDLTQKLTYTINVKLSDKPLAVLKSISATDDRGAPVNIRPIPTQDDVISNVYVDPAATSVNFIPRCSSGCWMTVNGQSVSNGQELTVQRELNRHRQIMDITCGVSRGQLSSIRRYIFSIVSDFRKDDIPKPRLVVAARGRECVFDSKHHHFDCPNPKATDYRTQLVGTINPAIRYTIESSDGSVMVRVLNDVPTIPFTYLGRGEMSLHAVAGLNNATWTVKFGGAPLPSFFFVLGWLIAAILGLLLLSLLGVLSVSKILGIGTPIGLSEVATAMTLLLQFFCFTSALRGSSILSDMTDVLKPVTFFWPLPWSDGNSVSHPETSQRFGDVTDVANAYGGLFWPLIVLSGVLLLHTGLIIQRKLFLNYATFSHRLALGNWENRVLSWLAFPVSAASASILTSSDSSVVWKSLAGISLGLYTLWPVAVYSRMKSEIASNKAVWMWQSAAREDGELEDESGFWTDAVCDQLMSQPVNRSLFKQFFPWKWVSTVGDITPMEVCPRLFARGAMNEPLYPVDTFHRCHKDANYALGKTPKTVDVYKTVAPNSFCPSQRIITGLLRTQWIDILFTSHALTKFHTEASSSRDFTVPLTVKTNQLTGPVTGGAHHFFYDGARIPFIRIADTLFRVLLGVCIGVILMAESNVVSASMFGLAAVAAIGYLTYHCVGMPYARRLENWIVGATLISIVCSSLSFMGYAAGGAKPSVFADIFLWLTCIASLVLAAYSTVVIFSVYSALICPPLEEARFLENLANSSVTIRNSNGEWAVDMPAYNKYGGRDLKAVCSYGYGDKMHVSVYPSGRELSIEFDAEEMVEACRSGSLRPPLISLTCPDTDSSVGYRHVNVYENVNLFAETAGFIAGNREIRGSAQDIARHVVNQVELRGQGKKLLSITVVPPKLIGGRGARLTKFSDGSSYPTSSADSSTGSSRKTSRSYTSSTSVSGSTSSPSSFARRNLSRAKVGTIHEGVPYKPLEIMYTGD